MALTNEAAYTWSVYACHPENPERRNSVVEMQVPADTAAQALASLEYLDYGLADHGPDALYFVVREDHVPGRDGQESVSHDHGLFRFNTDPTVEVWNG